MEDLLSGKLYVDDESKKLIHANYRIYSIIAVLFTFTSLMSLCIYVFRYFRHANQDYKNWMNEFSFHLFPIIGITQIVLSCFQFYNFFKAVQCQHEAAGASDPLLFNNSFRYFIKGSRVALIIIATSFFNGLLIFYMEIIAK